MYHLQRLLDLNKPTKPCLKLMQIAHEINGTRHA